MTIVLIILFAIGGVLAGITLWYIFRKLPTAWLLDYGESEISDELRHRQNLPVFPDAIILAMSEALLFVLIYLGQGVSVYTFLVLLATLPLVLIMTSDHKTRIIPDQFVIGLIPCAFLFWVHNAAAGTEDWITGLLWRLLAGLIGGLFLFLCGWVGERMLRREAMGMGDVKLVAVCGLLVGFNQLPLLLILSFISAAFLALPLLIRRLRNPESEAEMAFGPFIALACILVIGFSSFFNDLWLAYLQLLTR